jgi:hypothetical protein
VLNASFSVVENVVRENKAIDWSTLEKERLTNRNISLKHGYFCALTKPNNSSMGKGQNVCSVSLLCSHGETGKTILVLSGSVPTAGWDMRRRYTKTVKYWLQMGALRIQAIFGAVFKMETLNGMNRALLR